MTLIAMPWVISNISGQIAALYVTGLLWRSKRNKTLLQEFLEASLV
jgi:hypothetical protein